MDGWMAEIGMDGKGGDTTTSPIHRKGKGFPTRDIGTSLVHRKTPKHDRMVGENANGTGSGRYTAGTLDQERCS